MKSRDHHDDHMQTRFRMDFAGCCSPIIIITTNAGRDLPGATLV